MEYDSNVKGMEDKRAKMQLNQLPLEAWKLALEGRKASTSLTRGSKL